MNEYQVWGGNKKLFCVRQTSMLSCSHANMTEESFLQAGRVQGAASAVGNTWKKWQHLGNRSATHRNTQNVRDHISPQCTKSTVRKAPYVSSTKQAAKKTNEPNHNKKIESPSVLMQTTHTDGQDSRAILQISSQQMPRFTTQNTSGGT